MRCCAGATRRTSFLTRATSRQDGPLQLWHAASFELRGAIKAFEDAATTDADRELAGTWRETWSTYTIAEFGRVEIAINSGEIKTPRDALKTFEPLQAAIETMTDQAVEIAHQKTASAQQTSLEVDTAGSNTIWLVASIAAVVLIASVAWSLLFPASLTRPIKALHVWLPHSWPAATITARAGAGSPG